MSYDYTKLLQHPKWQKKRLEVLERAGFKCERCGAEEQQLHIHHWYYRKGKKPWEYEDRVFCCLCHTCHSAVRQAKGIMEEQIAEFGTLLFDAVTSFADEAYCRMVAWREAGVGYWSNAKDSAPGGSQ